MSKLQEELQRKIAFLEGKRSDVDRQLSIYRAALADEQNPNGTEEEVSTAGAQIKTDPEPPASEPSLVGLHSISTSAHADTTFVRNTISRNRKQGIDAAGIRAAAERKGLVVGDRFPYRILSKLKNEQAEIIRSVDGLYFPKGN